MPTAGQLERIKNENEHIALIQQYRELSEDQIMEQIEGHTEKIRAINTEYNELQQKGYLHEQARTAFVAAWILKTRFLSRIQWELVDATLVRLVCRRVENQISDKLYSIWKADYHSSLNLGNVDLRTDDGELSLRGKNNPEDLAVFCRDQGLIVKTTTLNEQIVKAKEKLDTLLQMQAHLDSLGLLSSGNKNI